MWQIDMSSFSLSDEIWGPKPSSHHSPSTHEWIVSSLLNVRHCHRPNFRRSCSLPHYCHPWLPQKKKAVEEPEEVGPVEINMFMHPTVNILFLTLSFYQQSHGDSNSEHSSLRAPAGSTPPKPYVPEGSPAAQLKAAGSRVSEE